MIAKQKKTVFACTYIAVVFGIGMLLPLGNQAAHVYAAGNPCQAPLAYVSGPDAQGNYVCQDATGADYTINESGQTQGATLPNGTQQNANGQSTDVETACSGWYHFFSQPFTCIGEATATFLGTALIWLASWVLTIAGLLFDWVITNTIMQFGNVVTPSVLNAINIAWSVFRDISNIVIIGMFTFIAIMTILGSTDYGAKKMISRVLIVAVLINFSLLFTKIIIDASNFTAIQFLNAASGYNAAACANCSQLSPDAQSSAGGVSTNTTPTGSTSGIAGAFMQYAGASTFGDTYKGLSAVAHDPQNGGWYALIYGVLISIFEVVAAVVLLYGAFLLIARALLMIFLMITSSIAFASYLVPSLAKSYGWSVWWSTLFRNALFAPFLAILLWVTLTVAQAYNGAAGGSLGQLVTNPTGSSLNIAALFGYILVIGLLFLSFRVASSFSAQIGGFNIATAVTGAPLSLGAQLTGTLGRQTFGRLGAWREGSLKKRRDEAIKDRDEGKASRLNLQLDRSKRFGLSKLGTRDFNAMNTGIGKSFAKAAGLSGLLAGTSKGGGIKKRAEEAAKEGANVGKELVLSGEQQKEIREEATRSYKESRAGDRKQLEDLHKTAQETLKATQESVATNKERFEHEKGEAQRELDKHNDTHGKIEQDYNKQLKQIADQIIESTAKNDMSEVARLESQKRAMEAKRDIELKEQAQKISSAKATVDKIQGKINAEDMKVTAGEKAVQGAKKTLDEFEKDVAKNAKEHGQRIADETADRFLKAAQNQAAYYAQRRLSNLPYALKPGDDAFAKEARSVVKKGAKDKGLKERLKAWREIDKEEGEGEAGK